MRDLFDRLVKEGETAIERLVIERYQEAVDLEFKQKENAAHGEPDRADRRNLAEVLSAFSNSMGGLIVWGIEAKKNSDNIDCATSLKPVAEIEKFRAAISRLISQALMPRHDAIFVDTVRQRPSPVVAIL
jgi:predicted HTH transcriptional regulator